ncbi:GTP-binding protein [Enterococcus faecalis]
METIFVDQSDKLIKEILELEPNEYQVEISNFFEPNVELTIKKTVISKVWFITGFAGSGKTTEINNLLRNNQEKKLIFSSITSTEDEYKEVSNSRYVRLFDIGVLGSLDIQKVIQQIDENLSNDVKIVVIDALCLFGNSGYGITEKNKIFLKQLLKYALGHSEIRFYIVSFPIKIIPRKVSVKVKNLSERKQELHDFLIAEGHGYLKMRKGKVFVMNQALWEELYWLELFERKVCQLSLVDDEQIFVEWKNKRKQKFNLKKILKKYWIKEVLLDYEK